MKHRILITLIFILGFIHLWAKSENKQPDSYAYTRGVEAFNEEKFADALDWFNRELSEHPDNGYAYAYISYLRYGKQEYGKALTAINQAIKKLPKKDKEYTALAYDTRAGIYLTMEDTISALHDYDAAIRLESQNKDHYERRAQVYFEQHMYDLADADYRKMISLDQGDVVGYMGIGRNAKEQGHYEDALQQFNYVIKMEPDYDSGYSFRAECYIAQKRYSEALDDIIKALSLSGDWKAYHLLVTMDEEALPLIKAKLQVQANKNPNDAKWLYSLGQVYEQNNRQREAISFYEQAHERDANAAFLERIANCYFDLGEYDNALDNIDRAIFMDNSDYDFVLLKGNIYNELGKYPEAIAELDKYIENTRTIFSVIIGEGGLRTKPMILTVPSRTILCLLP